MSEICQELHQLFQQLKRHYFPFDKKDLPKNAFMSYLKRGSMNMVETGL